MCEGSTTKTPFVPLIWIISARHNNVNIAGPWPSDRIHARPHLGDWLPLLTEMPRRGVLGNSKGDEGARGDIVTRVTLGELMQERSRLLLGKVEATKKGGTQDDFKAIRGSRVLRSVW